MKRYLLLLLFITGLQYCSYAQDIHFTTVEPPKENLWGAVGSMAQDPQGYLWMTTWFGLVKYDGKEYTHYQHEANNPNSVASDNLLSVFPDKHGTIWIGTYGGGLDRLDAVTNKFIHYRHHANDPSSLGCDSVDCILSDREGALWIGTFNGLDKFDPKTEKFKHFIHNAKDPGSISNNMVRKIYEDRAGTIWVGTGSSFVSDKTPMGEGGLNKFDGKTGKFTRYIHDANDSHTLIDNRVESIFEDSRGIFWVGTSGDGLHTMDRKTGKFERHLYDPAHPEKLSRPALKPDIIGRAVDHIDFINEDNAGRIWIGTFRNGINVYDPKTKKTVWYGKDANNKEKLSQNEFSYAYKTQDGVLWIAAGGGGFTLFKINPYQNKPLYTLMGKMAFAFMEDTAGALWLGTNNGLIRQGTGNKQKTFYKDKKTDSLKNGFYCIEKDEDNKFWLTSTSGLYQFDPATRVFTGYHFQNTNANSVSSDTITYVKKGTAGKLWVGTNKGLDLMDTKTGTFRHFRNDKKDPTSISNDIINSIEADKNNNVWVGTPNGLNKLDEKTGQFKRYLSNVGIYSLLNDSRGNLWVGTAGDLLKYDKNKDVFSTIDVNAKVFFGMAEDQNKNLWLNAGNGIIKLNTQNNEWNVYGINDGINMNNTLNWGYRRHNGDILFGDQFGYFTFQPDKLLHSRPAPTVVISSFLLNDVPVVAAKGGVLTQPPFSTTQIRLNHNQSTFSFGTSIIDYASEQGDDHSFYMLENYDNKWRKATSDGSANYYNIPPGQYIFKVKSVNNNGLVTEKHIAVIILPPWWQTWWAYTLFVLAFAGSIWGFIWYRSRALLREKRILEETVQLRTYEVMEQKEELQQQKEVLEAQAMEAKIETALERIRSCTMAMQKSDELAEVIQVIYEQLHQLNFDIAVASFAVDYKESDDLDVWIATTGQTYPAKIHIPYMNNPIFNDFKKAKESGVNFFADTCTFEQKNEFYEHYFRYATGTPEEIKKVIFSSPGFARSSVLTKNVVLTIFNYKSIPYTDAENALLKRFGKVFEQTYTRFNDLQKAEAAAIDAIKRASVDRVRAEIASMRSAGDLQSITPIIWNELTILGVSFIRCGVFIVDEQKQVIHSYLSTPDGKAIAAFQLAFNADGISKTVLTSWRKKQLAIVHWNEAEFKQLSMELVQQGAIASEKNYLTANPATSLDLHFIPFFQGMLYVGNTTPLSNDEINLVQSLADAFSTAYARYEDFNKLEAAKQQVDKTLTELKSAQTQLIQSEKMASLGELTAGIAHEIQNPLNFVNNFSEVSVELLAELKEEEAKGNKEDVIAIADDLTQNLEKIRHHGKRADAIVKGMLQHSQSGSGMKEPTNINSLADEYLRLSYHGLRSKDKSFNAEMVTHFDGKLPQINAIPQDIGRVLLNLFNNAFYAVNQKQKALGTDYNPEVSVTTSAENNHVIIKVKDNGIGIPDRIKEKIMQPFFTTKPTGEGTGLGLSLSYDMVVKGHGGTIAIETKEGTYTEFKITLPLN